MAGNEYLPEKDPFSPFYRPDVFYPKIENDTCKCQKLEKYEYLDFAKWICLRCGSLYNEIGKPVGNIN